LYQKQKTKTEGNRPQLNKAHVMIRFIKRWLPARDEVKKPKAVAKQTIAMLRREYQGKPFDVEYADTDPFRQFTDWFENAIQVIENDPNAMTLSTVDESGHPSSRTVLLKEYDESGFVFYTNYRSRKSSQIEKNPNVSITFFWPELMRQIHIEGKAEKTSASQSDKYFKTRPDGSKLGAWASEQSCVVASRVELDQSLREMKEKFKGGEIPRPPYWGGFRIKPNRLEFWQGRLNRLHDRICYIKEGKSWKIIRLSP
jgi:pyridoxamine 5'-phosphate oxidase